MKETLIHEKVAGGEDKRWFDEVDKGIQEPQVTKDAEALWGRLGELGLYQHAAELEIRGYTVVPPSVTRMRAGWVEEAREAIFDVAERRYGSRPTQDMDTSNMLGGGMSLSHILIEDPVFDEALLNPVALALSEVLVGRKAVMSSSVGGLKGRGDTDLALHTDALAVPSPFPSTCPGINMTWALTPYTRADGCLCVVPGSHRLFRHPLAGEALGQRVAVEAEEGSLILWGEYLWHGAFARTNPGLRVNLITSLQRPHMRSKERWDDVPPARIAANGPRYAELVDAPWGWGAEGPQSDAFGQNVDNAYD